MAPTNEKTPDVCEHPLMFTFRDAISGRGFLAGVTLSGKGIMVEEDGKWWLYGVRPAAIAESGRSPQDAFMRFRTRYQEVLFDIADESETFADLRTEIEAFFNQPDQEDEDRWDAALACVRAGHQVPDDFSDLPRRRPENTPFHVQVQRLDAQKAAEKPLFMPTDNVAENNFAVAA